MGNRMVNARPMDIDRWNCIQNHFASAFLVVLDLLRYYSWQVIPH